MANTMACWGTNTTHSVYYAGNGDTDKAFFREANQLADALTNEACEQQSRLIIQAASQLPIACTVRQIVSTYPKDQNKKNMQAMMAGNNDKAPKEIKMITIFRDKGKGKRLFTLILLIYYRLQEKIPATYTHFKAQIGRSWRNHGSSWV